jgi:hypothetical protein
MSKMPKWIALAGLFLVLIVLTISTFAQAPLKGESSYSPVVVKESFEAIMARMKAAKTGVMKRQMDLLSERYDLANRPASGVTMSRGKPVQEGVRVKLPQGITWERLAAMSPEEIHDKNLLPAGFYPLPTIPRGECSFPSSISKKPKGRKVVTSSASTLILIFPTTCCPNFRHPSISLRGPISGTFPKANYLLSTITMRSSTES